MPGRDDLEVAYDMARLVGSPKFHDWYDGPNANARFKAIADLVLELEVPGGSKSHRDDLWNRVRLEVGGMTTESFSS